MELVLVLGCEWFDALEIAEEVAEAYRFLRSDGFVWSYRKQEMAVGLSFSSVRWLCGVVQEGRSGSGPIVVVGIDGEAP